MNNISKELIITMVKQLDETDHKFLRQLYTIIKCHFLRTRDAMDEANKSTKGEQVQTMPHNL